MTATPPRRSNRRTQSLAVTGETRCRGRRALCAKTMLVRHSLREFDDHRALVSILDGQLPVTLTLVDLIHPRNHRDQ